ncbi:MAG: peptidoglycan DL-endopeptidase CwlO [Frankiales bacterium]|nr:peptidoglycan DL-endopeptidase CwlO [Frankiales bacterium]
MTVAALLGAALPASSAVAAPAPATSTKPPLADDITAAKAKLASLDDSLDLADENYRNGQIALQQATLTQAAANRRLSAGQARSAALKNRVDQIAVLAYQTGAAPDVMLATPDGAGDLAESTAVLSQFAADQDNILSAAAAAQYDLAVAQTAATQSATATARTAAQLAAAKAVIVGQVASHKAIVTSLITRQHTLEAIAAEKARLAAIAAAKAAAERQAAAKKAAEAAAAAALAEAQKAAAAAAAAKAAAEQEAAQRAADQRRQAAVKAAAQRQASAQESTGGSSGGGSSGGGSSGGGSSGGSSGSAGPPSSRAATAVAAAYQQLGAPYDWAADGPAAFDCSGLTAYAWAAAGVTLPHSSQAQFGVGAHVSRSQLAPGDLVFFGSPIHHVGIYVGNGNMIDAPQTGDVVRVQSINRSDYAGAVRVTG